MATQAEQVIRMATQKLLETRRIQQRLNQLTPGQAQTVEPGAATAGLGTGIGAASVMSQAALANLARRSPFVANSSRRVRKAAGMTEMPELPGG